MIHLQYHTVVRSRCHASTHASTHAPSVYYDQRRTDELTDVSITIPLARSERRGSGAAKERTTAPLYSRHRFGDESSVHCPDSTTLLTKPSLIREISSIVWRGLSRSDQRREASHTQTVLSFSPLR